MADGDNARSDSCPRTQATLLRDGTGDVDDLAKVGRARCDSAQFLGRWVAGSLGRWGTGATCGASGQINPCAFPLSFVNKAVSCPIPNPGVSVLASARNAPVRVPACTPLDPELQQEAIPGPAPSHKPSIEPRAPSTASMAAAQTTNHSRLTNGERPRSWRSRCPVAKDVPVHAQDGSWMPSTSSHQPNKTEHARGHSLIRQVVQTRTICAPPLLLLRDYSCKHPRNHAPASKGHVQARTGKGNTPKRK